MKQHSHELSHFSKVHILLSLAKQEHVTGMLNHFSMLHKQPQSLEYCLGLDQTEVKSQGKRLADFLTLLASGNSGRCTWWLLTHCCSWLTTTLLQTGGMDGSLGRGVVPAFGMSHFWTGTAAAARSRGERLGWLFYALND